MTTKPRILQPGDKQPDDNADYKFYVAANPVSVDTVSVATARNKPIVEDGGLFDAEEVAAPERKRVYAAAKRRKGNVTTKQETSPVATPAISKGGWRVYCRDISVWGLEYDDAQRVLSEVVPTEPPKGAVIANAYDSPLIALDACAQLNGKQTGWRRGTSALDDDVAERVEVSL